ncbi:MAG: hypothetical protein A6F71_07080 [Cycloclasticus sp. symbiont of Poecilosclerida sp. M]|nr:MAG: hypothetical protein A6F71_07080 [Cycloclasticus sp. symbiont of Poecilosclerida sp. M]
MLKKIDFGKTNFSDLYQLFNFNSPSELEAKRARLFPSGNTDKEIATTSIFLASLCAAKEYREDLLTTLNVNKIRTRNVNLHAYTELSDVTKEKRPDGLLVLTSGKHNPIIEWAAFIEAKVGKTPVDSSQVERYISFCREIGIHTLISISNEMVTSPTDSPITTRKSRFNLNHWSWKYISVTAKKLVRDNAVKDEDHIFLLNELRRYLDNHKNVLSHNSMGQHWAEAAKKIHSLKAKDKIDTATLKPVVTAYKQEEKDISLELTDTSGCHVELVAKGDRTSLIEKMLQESKAVTTNYILNRDKTAQFQVVTDFIRHEVRCTTTYSNTGGKAKAQTTALLKILDQTGIAASDYIYIKALYPRNKSVLQEVTLTTLLNEKERREPYSIIDKELGAKIKSFEITTKDLLGKKFVSPSGFIEKIEKASKRFLEQVMASIITNS